MTKNDSWLSLGIASEGRWGFAKSYAAACSCISLVRHLKGWPERGGDGWNGKAKSDQSDRDSTSGRLRSHSLCCRWFCNLLTPVHGAGKRGQGLGEIAGAFLPVGSGAGGRVTAPRRAHVAPQIRVNDSLCADKQLSSITAWRNVTCHRHKSVALPLDVTTSQPPFAVVKLWPSRTGTLKAAALAHLETSEKTVNF